MFCAFWNLGDQSCDAKWDKTQSDYNAVARMGETKKARLNFGGGFVAVKARRFYGMNCKLIAAQIICQILWIMDTKSGFAEKVVDVTRRHVCLDH